MTDAMSEVAIAAQRKYKREYMRRWRAEHPEKVQANNRRYWERRALREEQEATKDDKSK